MHCKKISSRFFKQINQHRLLVYFIIYSIIFFIAFFLAFFWFFKLNKSFIWEADGLFMHYNFLGYMGEFLRNILSSLQNGDLSVPLWSYDFGYGSDILTMLNARLGDPFNYLSVFFQRYDTEKLHNFLAILRIYCAGITFSLYSFKHNIKRFPTLCGSLVYCFCGLVFWVGVRHLYFINPMIYFPLVLWGAENILKTGKGKLFTFMIFLCAIGNFYFFYMITLLTVIYTIILFVLEKHDNFVKEIILALLKFIKFYLLGVGLSAFLFLPTIISYFNNGRTSVNYENSLFLRSIKYYIEFIPRWISQGLEYGEATGYIPLALICVIILFSIRKRELKHLKIIFVVFTFFLLIPFFGYVFNGFSYVTDRWIFGYSFIVAFIVAECIPYLLEPYYVERIKPLLAIVSIGLSLFCIINSDLYTTTFLAGAGVLGISCFVILFLLPYFKAKKFGKEISYGMIILLIFFSIWVNGDTRFSVNKEDYVSEYLDKGTAEYTLTNSPASAAIALDSSSDFYRIDETQYIMNTQVAQHFKGVAFYTSLLDSKISEFHRLLGVSNATHGQTFNFKGVDRRAFLEALLNVRYYATVADDSQIPYGFENISTDQTYSEGKAVYKNTYEMPFGITYDSYMTYSEFEKLSVTERQQALLQSIVVDDKIMGFEEKAPEYTDEKIDYSITCDDGIEISDNSIYVEDTNSVLTLNFNGLEDSETYLWIKGINMTSVKNTEDNIYWEPKTTMHFTVGAENFNKSYTYRSPADKAYTGIHDYLINLGYSANAKNSCTIRFDAPGIYSFDELSIYCQPVSNLSKYTDQLSMETLESVVVDSNSIEGEISLSEDKILYLSIPYSSGWTLYVDGTETELISGNIMGMAIPLSSGEHNIFLIYRTPGLKTGAMISIGTLIILIVVMISKFIRKRGTKND